MNGAEHLIRTAVQSGIKVCFANPGTTEMPLVSALSSVPGIQVVAGLFEGVCTGAADGYGRLAQKPAMTLLHMGPGLANGLANLHNAKRAHTPLLNIIGEHASWHRDANAPLTMNIQGLAKTVSTEVITVRSAENISENTARAIDAAMAGGVATLIVPHDCQWARPSYAQPIRPFVDSTSPEQSTIEGALKFLSVKGKTALLLGGAALRKPGLSAASRIRAGCGCDLLADTFPALLERGQGIEPVTRIPYFPEAAKKHLVAYDRILLAGTDEPVPFFGYENGPRKLIESAQKCFRLVSGAQDPAFALKQLADAMDAPAGSVLERSASPMAMPQGPITAKKACQVVAALQPENAIVVDESVTSGAAWHKASAVAPPHTLLTLTGGALGQGMPCATGAAMACRKRPVINLQADGSAMYTVQALWTQARQSLNVTTLLFSNRSYNILKIELARAGVKNLPKSARALTDLFPPELNWIEISRGMGVPAVRVETAEALAAEFTCAIADPGPRLIEIPV